MGVTRHNVPSVKAYLQPLCNRGIIQAKNTGLVHRNRVRPLVPVRRYAEAAMMELYGSGMT